jgi:hypothetical protein
MPLRDDDDSVVGGKGSMGETRHVGETRTTPVLAAADAGQVVR